VSDLIADSALGHCVADLFRAARASITLPAEPTVDRSRFGMT